MSCRLGWSNKASWKRQGLSSVLKDHFDLYKWREEERGEERRERIHITNTGIIGIQNNSLFWINIEWIYLIIRRKGERKREKIVVRNNLLYSSIYQPYN